MSLRTPLAVLLTTSLAACGSSSGPPANGNPDAQQFDAPGAPADAGKLTFSEGVTVTVEPNGNNGSELVAAIGAATTSVYLTMYTLDDTALINALVAKASTLDEQVILDGSTTNKSGNTSAFNKLTTAGANVVWSNPDFTYTHEKTLILDATTAWIMTMNWNTTSVKDNREYLAFDTNADDVEEATAIFKADHALKSITPNGNLVVANSNARVKLADLIGTATTTLDLEVEEFSDSNSGGIVDAVVAAAKRGVKCRVVIANTDLSSAETAANAAVKAVGVAVVMTGPQSGSGTPGNPYIHAKAITIDCNGTTCAAGFVGSENFSTGSLSYNRELGVLLDNATELAKVETAINTDFAAGKTL